jgi:uncharacterized damage-inducible protein DinB
MSYPNFTHPVLAKQFATYKWARNNTLQILKVAQDAGIMDFTPHKDQHSVLYQFQCLITTDNVYYRKLTNSADKRFGLLIQDGREVKKTDIPEDNLRKLLQANLTNLESLLATFDNKQFEANAQDIQRIFNHEYLHQGQLVVLFRQAGIELPERFKKAFDL